MKSDPGATVVMLLNDLNSTQLRVIPPAYRLRTFTDGDEQTWMQIQSVSDFYNTITPALFASQFGANAATLRERQLYIVDEHRDAVGTVTAWFPECGVDPHCGRLHWLAVIPDRQHQGLGHVLVSAALVRMRQLGYERAYLTSSLARQGALRLYEHFGFQVVPSNEFYLS